MDAPMAATLTAIRHMERALALLTRAQTPAPPIARDMGHSVLEQLRLFWWTLALVPPPPAPAPAPAPAAMIAEPVPVRETRFAPPVLIHDAHGRPYECPAPRCGKRKKASLEAHLDHDHKPWARFTTRLDVDQTMACPVPGCGATYAFADRLRRHMQKKHPPALNTATKE